LGYFIFRGGGGACAMAQWPVLVWADSWLLSLNLTNIVELGRTGFGYGYYACKQIWALGSHLLGGGGGAVYRAYSWSGPDLVMSYFACV